MAFVPLLLVAILSGLQLFISAVYLIFLPLNLYYFVKTLQFIYKNRENALSTGKKQTYRNEIRGCQQILQKYYLYRNEMQQMGQAMEEGTFSLTMDEMYARFDTMQYANAVEIASPFRGIFHLQ